MCSVYTYTNLKHINLNFYPFHRLASSACHHISSLLGLKWELRGKEHLEKDEACIIVANHQSSLDILGTNFY